MLFACLWDELHHEHSAVPERHSQAAMMAQMKGSVIDRLLLKSEGKLIGAF